MACEYCEDIKYKIYEDDIMIGFLDSNPVAIGHVVLVPKKHYTILEQVPDEIMSKMFTFANKISGILFEVLQVQGTNTLINNGVDQEVPHFSINIIPRVDKDNVNFEWDPQKIADDRMDVLIHNIKEGLKEKKEPIEEVKEEPVQKSGWMEKLLNRIP